MWRLKVVPRHSTVILSRRGKIVVAEPSTINDESKWQCVSEQKEDSAWPLSREAYGKRERETAALLAVNVDEWLVALLVPKYKSADCLNIHDPVIIDCSVQSASTRSLQMFGINGVSRNLVFKISLALVKPRGYEPLAVRPHTRTRTYLSFLIDN